LILGKHPIDGEQGERRNPHQELRCGPVREPFEILHILWTEASRHRAVRAVSGDIKNEVTQAPVKTTDRSSGRTALSIKARQI
jgi:hypothetical protein